LASIPFRSRLFRPFHCDIVAAFSKENSVGQSIVLIRSFIDHLWSGSRAPAKIYIQDCEMSLFDKSQAPPECPDDLLKAINDLIDRLRMRLVDKITLPSPPYGFRIPNMTRGYIQAHLRRLIMFLDGGYAEFVAGRPLMTEMASRAIYENVANFFDFARKLKPLCEAGKYKDVEALVSKAAFVTRVPSILQEHGVELSAPQILNQIDRMTKQWPTFRDAYDRLSDIVHPNGLGAIVYFATIKDEDMNFHPTGLAPERPVHSLFLAAILLASVEVEIAEMEAALTKLGNMMNLAKLIVDDAADEQPR
jgi:hypothetical protein